MLIDTHAHIYLDQFKDDLDLIISEAQENEVSKILMPNIDVDTIDDMHSVEAQYPDVAYAMMGLHPSSVHQGFEDTLETIEKNLYSRPYIAVGEIGIDLYWDETFKKEQEKAFLTQAHWAVELNIPIVIHCRNSIDLTIDLLEKEKIQGLRGIFHCFGGEKEYISKIRALGFYIGIGGVITYKNSNLKEILTKEDMDMIVLETDAPYLSPVPHRGKRNESSYLSIIADYLANAVGISLEEVHHLTTSNALGLFDLGTKNVM